MTVVLVNMYAGTLFSFMSVRKFGAVINSLDDLARWNDTQLTVHLERDFTDRFLVRITNKRPLQNVCINALKALIYC